MTMADTHEETCQALKYALGEGYLDRQMGLVKEDGSINIRYPGPCIPGPNLTARGRKHKPNLIISYCPWCGANLSATTSQDDPGGDNADRS